ncbi:hypothetical protein GCM10026982_56550 [Nocardiopsis aegyptia]
MVIAKETLTNRCVSSVVNRKFSSRWMARLAIRLKMGIIVRLAPKVTLAIAMAQAISTASWINCPMIIHFTYSTWLAALRTKSPSWWAASAAALT